MAIRKDRKTQKRVANLDGNDRFDKDPCQWLGREEFLAKLNERYKEDSQVQEFLTRVLAGGNIHDVYGRR